MKKTYCLPILALLCCLHSYGQEYDVSQAPADVPGININKIHIGIYIAPNASWMYPTSSKSDDRNYYVHSNGGKAGYMWGLMVDYFFAQNYGLTTGFDLNTTGGKIATNYDPNQISSTDANTVLYSDFNYHLQYIEIPFDLKLRSDKITETGLRIFGQIGLTAAINISKKASYSVNYNDNAGINRELNGDNEKLIGTLSAAPVMLQLNIGAGIEYPFTRKLHFYSGLFFNNGFLPNTISPKNYDLGYSGSFTDGYVRLNNLALRIGLFF